MNTKSFSKQIDSEMRHFHKIWKQIHHFRDVQRWQNTTTRHSKKVRRERYLRTIFAKKVYHLYINFVSLKKVELFSTNLGGNTPSHVDLLHQRSQRHASYFLNNTPLESSRSFIMCKTLDLAFNLLHQSCWNKHSTSRRTNF